LLHARVFSQGDYSDNGRTANCRVSIFVGQLAANLFEMKATLLPKLHSAREWSAVASQIHSSPRSRSPGHQSGAAFLSQARSTRLVLGEKAMLISFSTLVLASQLIVTVADDVPNFNIERGCKVDSASAFDPNAGLNTTIKRCADDEQKAKDQLQPLWSQFGPSDKKICMGLATDDASTPPSYVELLTCLQAQQLARKLPKD
jgi:hypothetical protein